MNDTQTAFPLLLRLDEFANAIWQSSVDVNLAYLAYYGVVVVFIWFASDIGSLSIAL